jgi:hypothetical protein
MLEAARLGSYMAKRGALTLFEAKQVNLDIQPREHLEWPYDILLAQMPSRRQLMDRATKSVPGIPLHTKVLGKVFESECLRLRVIIKRAIEADNENPQIKQAFEFARNGDLSRLKLILDNDSGNVLKSSVNGYNLLHVAAEYGHPAVVQLVARPPIRYES